MCVCVCVCVCVAKTDNSIFKTVQESFFYFYFYPAFQLISIKLQLGCFD